MKKEDIKFSNGKSSDAGRGYGNANPKISYQIDGVQKRWKAIFRGDDHYGSILSDVVVVALQSDVGKQYLIDYENGSNIIVGIKKETNKTIKSRMDELLEGVTKRDFEYDMSDEEEKVYREYTKKRNEAKDQAEMEVYGEGDDARYDFENSLKEKYLPKVNFLTFFNISDGPSGSFLVIFKYTNKNKLKNYGKYNDNDSSR